MLAGAACACALLLLLCASASAGAAPRCTIVGTNGPDTLHGKSGPDVICGRGGNDHIAGGAGADQIRGGAGDDELFGGAGKDVLLGGAGEDSCLDSASAVFVSCEKGSQVNRQSPPLTVPPLTPAFGAPPAGAPPADEQPPTEIHLSFAWPFAETGHGETSIEVGLEAWDRSGIGAISIEIDGPDGPWRQLQLEGETDQRTGLNTTVAVPVSTPAGDYWFSSLTISDRAGNVRTISAAEIREASEQPEFEVYAGPDVAGPTLTDFSLSSTEVDTSHAPATIEISIGARDALSGVKSAVAVVVLPDWEPGPLEIGAGSSGQQAPTTGTKHDGVWATPYSLIEHAMPGYYKVLGVYLRDLAGNLTHYTRSELQGLGYPVDFLQSGGGDTTSPEILDLWLEPSHLRTSAGERTIFFYTHVRDDITGFGQWPDEGFSRVDTDFEPPGEWHEFSTSGRVPELISGSELDGIWRHEVRLEEDAPPGEYKLTFAAVTDRAGNDLILNRAAIESHGWPDSFINEP